MREAGFRYVFLGIENILDEDLAFLRASSQERRSASTAARSAMPRKRAIEVLHRHEHVRRRRADRRQPEATRASRSKPTSTFARERVDWPYIQHPTPYPGTPMTKDFRERGLIVNDRLEEYDGTTAVVRSEHLPAEEIEFMRWRAERWMKLRHFWPTLTHSPWFVLRHGPADAAPHVPGRLLAFASRPGNRARGLRAISIDQTAGTRQLHLTVVTVTSTVD